MTNNTVLKQLLTEIDRLNNDDPNKVIVDGESNPISKEVIYSQRMQSCLKGFSPDASEPLQIAAYCQHIKRWAIPRSDYPMNKSGYYQWRITLGKYHADTTAGVMEQFGYDIDSIERVKYLLQKKGLKQDPETQILEDVICLTFMEYYLDDFSAKHSEEKIISIIQKTWKKMSDDGHASALSLPLAPHLLDIVKKSLGI